MKREGKLQITQDYKLSKILFHIFLFSKEIENVKQ